MLPAKQGKTAPVNAIPCCEPDPVTGHHPHWVPVDSDNPADKWFVEAYKNTPQESIYDGTYEALGPHFQGNPYNLDKDVLQRHGTIQLDVPRTFEGIKKYLYENEIEGIIFWLNGEAKCKIKRSDFGF